MQNIEIRKVEVKLTKPILHEIIKWNPSRYNFHKKKEVVDRIYKGMINGGACILIAEKGEYEKVFNNSDGELSSGSYYESGSLGGGGAYTVSYKNKTIFDKSQNIIYKFRI